MNDTILIADDDRELLKIRKYHISSKQYAEKGMRIKLISKEKPDMPCVQAETALEDAYIYMTNFALRYLLESQT